MTRARSLYNLLADHARERAQQAALRGRFGEAEHYLAELRELVPNSYHAFLLTAKVRLRECRFDECRDALVEAERRGHDPAENALMAAWVERYVAKRADVAGSGSIQRSIPPASGAEAPELGRLGTTRDALSSISALRRHLQRYPSCPVGLARMAEALTAKALHWAGSPHVLAMAEAAAWRAVSIAPGCAEGYVALGCVFELEGNTIDAERQLRKALSRDPGHWFAHYVLGGLLTRQGRYEKASCLLAVALDRAPDFIATYDYGYRARVGLGDLEGAAELANAGIARARTRCDVEPRDLLALAGVAVLLGRIGDQEAADEAVKVLTRRFPKSGCGWAHAALAQAVIGNAEGVEGALRLAREFGFAVAVMTRRSEFDAFRADSTAL